MQFRRASGKMDAERGASVFGEFRLLRFMFFAVFATVIGMLLFVAVNGIRRWSKGEDIGMLHFRDTRDLGFDRRYPQNQGEMQ